MFYQKYLSRKFLLPLLVAILAYLKGTEIIELDPTLVIGLITAVLAFIGIEGWKDIIVAKKQ